MSSLEKINPFLWMALFNNSAVFLKCMYQEKGERSRVKLFISPLLQTAPNLGSETSQQQWDIPLRKPEVRLLVGRMVILLVMCPLPTCSFWQESQDRNAASLCVKYKPISSSQNKPSPVDISVWPRWCRQHPWCLHFRPYRNLWWSQRLNLGHWACACFQFSTAHSDAQTAHSRQYQVLV